MKNSDRISQIENQILRLSELFDAHRASTASEAARVETRMDAVNRFTLDAIAQINLTAARLRRRLGAAPAQNEDYVAGISAPPNKPPAARFPGQPVPVPRAVPEPPRTRRPAAGCWSGSTCYLSFSDVRPVGRAVSCSEEEMLYEAQGYYPESSEYVSLGKFAARDLAKACVDGFVAGAYLEELGEGN